MVQHPPQTNAPPQLTAAPTSWCDGHARRVALATGSDSANDVVLVAAFVMALVFAFTNGFQDAANAIATLVATRAARPLPAIIMASIANLLGPFLLAAAVADTVAGS